MFLSGRESQNRVNSVYFYLPKRKVLRGDVACRTSPREPQADASSLWPAGEHGSSLGLSECRLDCSSHPHSMLTHTVFSHTQHAHSHSKRLAYRLDCSGQWADQEDLQSGKERDGQQAGQYSSTFQFGSANRKGVAKPDGLLVMPFEILADFDILNRLLRQKTSIVPHTTSCSHDENQGTGG